MGLVGKSGHLVIISIKVMKTVMTVMMIMMNRMRKRESPKVIRPVKSLPKLKSRNTTFGVLYRISEIFVAIFVKRQHNIFAEPL